MKKITPLCKLAYKYGVDKCPQIKHRYTPFYFELLKDKRKAIKKVLEMGIGYAAVMQHVVRVKGFYKNGASLYMWRDFFPQAQIYGADILPELLFSDERITTYICDQTNKDSLVKLVKAVGEDIDLFIDDGSHHWRDQVFTCQNLLPLLKKDVIYIIEDARDADIISASLNEYTRWIPNLRGRFRDDKVVVVAKK